MLEEIQNNFNFKFMCCDCGRKSNNSKHGEFCECGGIYKSSVSFFLDKLPSNFKKESNYHDAKKFLPLKETNETQIQECECEFIEQRIFGTMYTKIILVSQCDNCKEKYNDRS